MKHCYVPRRFKPELLDRIDTANTIIDTYMEMGLRLTVRQLFYQFVSRHDYPNTPLSYQNLAALISHARLAGLIDWDAIEDRGRVADVPREWSSINKLIDVAIEQFRLPRWEGQENYVELWVEKQALAGVLEPVASEFHVTLMVNKGYSSSSAMYESAQRFLKRGRGKEPYLLYLGDHDPSGEDMVRDIRDRLTLFGVEDLVVEKVALTMAQIEQYDPPPNPAKVSDSRAAKYIEKFGRESWEVDALDPATLVSLIRKQFIDLLDREQMGAVLAEERAQTAKLRKFMKGSKK